MYLMVRVRYAIVSLALLIFLADLELAATAVPPSHDGADRSLLLERSNKSFISTDLPPHYWQLAKSSMDISTFQDTHHLILVASWPQEAAMQPSWPQALVQYFLIAPPLNLISTSGSRTIINGEVVGGSTHNLAFWSVVQLLFLPFTFIAWTVNFGTLQVERATAGWIAVMGWTFWFDVVEMLFSGKKLGKLIILPFALFQWAGSLAVIIQRWTAGLGAIAYQVTDLRGCVPVDGLDYLQQGARAWNFQVLQTVTFSVATMYAAMVQDKSRSINDEIALLALGELIYTAIVGGQGMPMVVSGNCLLVELNPSRGFLDSPIMTRWKVFSSFMGF